MYPIVAQVLCSLIYLVIVLYMVYCFWFRNVFVWYMYVWWLFCYFIFFVFSY